MTDEVRAEFQAAVTTARMALAEFNREPMVESKRGADRVNPWWRIYVESSEIAARWYRQLEGQAERSIDEEIDRLLGPAGE